MPQGENDTPIVFEQLFTEADIQSLASPWSAERAKAMRDRLQQFWGQAEHQGQFSPSLSNESARKLQAEFDEVRSAWQTNLTESERFINSGAPQEALARLRALNDLVGRMRERTRQEVMRSIVGPALEEALQRTVEQSKEIERGYEKQLIGLAEELATIVEKKIAELGKVQESLGTANTFVETVETRKNAASRAAWGWLVALVIVSVAAGYLMFFPWIHGKPALHSTAEYVVFRVAVLLPTVAVLSLFFGRYRYQLIARAKYEHLHALLKGGFVHLTGMLQGQDEALSAARADLAKQLLGADELMVAAGENTKLLLTDRLLTETKPDTKKRNG